MRWPGPGYEDLVVTGSTEENVPTKETGARE